MANATGSLANQAFHRYVLEHGSLGSAAWRVVFTSDDPRYGGEAVADVDPIESKDGQLTLRLPPRSRSRPRMRSQPREWPFP